MIIVNYLFYDEVIFLEVNSESLEVVFFVLYIFCGCFDAF